ncbi:MAG: hypothetical protein ACFE8N_15200 [Promethearchaeota archaeon]
MSLWKKIAKNELRLKTNRVRKHRKLFFVIIYTFFLFWAIYLGPTLLDAIIPEIIKEFSSMIIPIFSTLLEYTFMIMFILYMMYPIFMLYRKAEIGYKDILLASPISAGDIFVGEFIGQLPFYFLFILGLGPFVNSILLQLNPSLTLIHNFIIYVVIFTLLILGLLIGTIIASWLEHTMTVKRKKKELNYSLLLLLTFVLILSFYFFHFLFDLIEDHPELRNWLSFYPSFWYSDILLYIVDPTLVSTYFLNIWVSIGLAIIVPLLILLLSYKKVNVFYRIEEQIERSSMRVRKEKKIHKFIGKITPHRYKNLVITQFKDFFRKKENIPKLVYIGAFTAILGLFMRLSLGGSLLELGSFWVISPYIIQIVYFDYLLVMVLSWIGGLLFGVFIGIYVLIGSKNVIFLYKKSGRGIKTLIYSFFFEMFYIILFLDIILTIFFTILFPLDFLTGITFFFFYLLNTFLLVMHAVGIQCIKPLFDERGKNVYFNIYFIVLLQIISLLIAVFIVVPNVPQYFDHSLGLLYILLINLGVSYSFAFVLHFLGIWNLNRVE